MKKNSGQTKREKKVQDWRIGVLKNKTIEDSTILSVGEFYIELFRIR